MFDCDVDFVFESGCDFVLDVVSRCRFLFFLSSLSLYISLSLSFSLSLSLSLPLSLCISIYMFLLSLFSHYSRYSLDLVFDVGSISFSISYLCSISHSVCTGIWTGRASVQTASLFDFDVRCFRFRCRSGLASGPGQASVQTASLFDFDIRFRVRAKP